MSDEVEPSQAEQEAAQTAGYMAALSGGGFMDNPYRGNHTRAYRIRVLSECWARGVLEYWDKS